MNRTYASINWARTRQDDGTKIHIGTRAGWTFTIRTPLDGRAVLTGQSRDGRSVRTAYLTIRAAKEGALMHMHPAEAMAWHRNEYTGAVEADWDDFSFTATCNESGTWDLRVSQRGQDPVISAGLPCMADVRQTGFLTLIEHYGPIVPSDKDRKTSATLREVETLEEALKTAGIRFTARQLATAALVLSR